MFVCRSILVYPFNTCSFLASADGGEGEGNCGNEATQFG